MDVKCRLGYSGSRTSFMVERVLAADRVRRYTPAGRRWPWVSVSLQTMEPGNKGSKTLAELLQKEAEQVP